jgi:hypothetical protein
MIFILRTYIPSNFINDNKYIIFKNELSRLGIKLVCHIKKSENIFYVINSVKKVNFYMMEFSL